MTTQELQPNNLQALSDLELRHFKSRVEEEVERRSQQRVERTFQSFSHLNKVELAKLQTKIADYLDHPLVSLDTPLVQLEKVAPEPEKVTPEPTGEVAQQINPPENNTVQPLVVVEVQSTQPAVEATKEVEEMTFSTQEIEAAQELNVFLREAS